MLCSLGSGVSVLLRKQIAQSSSLELISESAFNTKPLGKCMVLTRVPKCKLKPSCSGKSKVRQPLETSKGQAGWTVLKCLLTMELHGSKDQPYRELFLFGALDHLGTQSASYAIHPEHRQEGSCLKGTYKPSVFSCPCHGTHTGSSQCLHSVEEEAVIGKGLSVALAEVLLGRTHLGRREVLVCDFPLNRKRWFTFSIYISQ